MDIQSPEIPDTATSWPASFWYATIVQGEDDKKHWTRLASAYDIFEIFIRLYKIWCKIFIVHKMYPII